MKHVEYWIWLQRALGQGSQKPALLLERLGNIEAVYAAGAHEYAAIQGLTARETVALCDKNLDFCKVAVEKCLQNNYSLITPEDVEYPQRLRSIYAPPCVLYVWGRLAPVDEAVLIAMVGTRRVTEYGLRAAQALSAGLAAHGAVVVSGLAAGVDTAAHKGALKGGGRTYAVVGCGLDVNYPAANRELKRLIAANGAVISEYPPGTPPLSGNFPTRNRIIAGLSLGTVVVEAGNRSGALITAALAAEAGRDVFAVPGSIFSPLSTGANRLLRDGAKPACCVADILEEYIGSFAQQITLPPKHMPEAEGETVSLPASGEPARAAKSRPLRPEPTGAVPTGAEPAAGPPPLLTPTQEAVYKALCGEPTHVDQIAMRANLEPRIVLGALTALEIQGFAKSYPGRRFVAVPGGSAGS